MASRAKHIHPLVGKQIKQLRLAEGLTQKELAERLNKSESAVRMWELGKSEPDIEMLRRIAELFGTSADHLLGKEEAEKSEHHSAGEDELSLYLDELRNRPEMRMLFSLASGATKEDVEQAVAIIEALRNREHG
ncbi:MAG: helix-turn-helix transcriptional regulator [Clostridia bacterium]|nr:helix-turn-helix transcriptional regulator [Clostridia bacterium]